MREPLEIQFLSFELELDLKQRYGLMVGGSALWRELGYTSYDAFRKAKQRGTIEVPLFEVPNRRGVLCSVQRGRLVDCYAALRTAAGRMN